MANRTEIKVPDIGGYDDVPVIELLVAVGDTVKLDQGLVTLESDKATMEVPSSVAGKIVELKVKVGDKLSEGSVVAIVEAEGAADAPAAKETPAAKEAPAPAKAAPPPAAQAPTAPPHPPVTASPSAPTPTPGPTAAPTTGRKADIECAMVVIGAGPGGYNAAFRAADLDMDTVLVERYATLRQTPPSEA